MQQSCNSQYLGGPQVRDPLLWSPENKSPIFIQDREEEAPVIWIWGEDLRI